MTAADINLRAVQLGSRLFHLLAALDPEPTAAPLLAAPISTPNGFLWPLELSERAVELLTDLLEAAEPRRSGVRPPLHLVHSSPEVAS
ncbi:hypothetical protein AB0M68_03715 [Streptomyces sp. NPDC051453]|uniref:hypothetical protein n=1 Tax=Streptomyces sp. NPDC051453 TaxID=3154941 RepID=UPI003440CD25